MNEGDVLLFYAGRPVGGVIGFGIVKAKARQERTPIWEDEVRAGRVLYPLRIEFDAQFCFPLETWQERAVLPPSLKPLVRAGFQPLRPAIAGEIIRQLSPNWSPAVSVAGIEVPSTEGETPQVSHDDLKKMLVEIGRIQKFLAEPEYAMDIGRLDVVWRRIEKSVPTYVFEVQVGGDVYHAIAKLKHAYDLWNSHIFLVADQQERGRCEQLLGGTFHEIRGVLRFLPIDKICELYKRKRAFKDLERQLDIPA